MHAWLTATGRPAACRLLILFAGLHYAVHSLDVLRGPPVDVAVGVPVLAVVVVVVVIARPHSCSLVLVVPLRRRRGCRFHLLLPPAGALLLAAEQRRKKGALFSSPQPNSTALSKLYSTNWMIGSSSKARSRAVSLVSRNVLQHLAAGACGLALWGTGRPVSCIYRRLARRLTPSLARMWHGLFRASLY